METIIKLKVKLKVKVKVKVKVKLKLKVKKRDIMSCTPSESSFPSPAETDPVVHSFGDERRSPSERVVLLGGVFVQCFKLVFIGEGGFYDRLPPGGSWQRS